MIHTSSGPGVQTTGFIPGATGPTNIKQAQTTLFNLVNVKKSGQYLGRFALAESALEFSGLVDCWYAHPTGEEAVLTGLFTGFIGRNTEQLYAYSFSQADAIAQNATDDYGNAIMTATFNQALGILQGDADKHKLSAAQVKVLKPLVIATVNTITVKVTCCH